MTPHPDGPAAFLDEHRWRFIPGFIALLLFPRLAGPITRWVFGQEVTEADA